MRIGIDIDGVLTDLEQFHYDCGSKLMLGKKMINPNGYNINEIYDMTDDDYKKFFSDYFINYIKNYKAREFASEVIKKLKKEQNQIYIITARGCDDSNSRLVMNRKENIKNVKRWLCRNHIRYNHIIFSAENKAQICIDNKIDVMIDDSPLNLINVSKQTKMIAFNANYNQDIKNDNIIRCYSWYDIYKKLKRR